MSCLWEIQTIWMKLNSRVSIFSSANGEWFLTSSKLNESTTIQLTFLHKTFFFLLSPTGIATGIAYSIGSNCHFKTLRDSSCLLTTYIITLDYISLSMTSLFTLDLAPVSDKMLPIRSNFMAYISMHCLYCFLTIMNSSVWIRLTTCTINLSKLTCTFFSSFNISQYLLVASNDGHGEYPCDQRQRHSRRRHPCPRLHR